VHVHVSDAPRRDAAELARQVARAGRRQRVAERAGGSLATELRQARARLVASLAPAANASATRRISRRTQAALSGSLRRPIPIVPPPMVCTLRDVLRVLLLAPVRLVFIADGTARRMRMRLFATTAPNLVVDVAMFDADERRVLAYLMNVASAWLDEDAYARHESAAAAAGSAVRDDMVPAGPLLNDSFALALNRPALVWAACDTYLYAAGIHVHCRHLLEAALLALAATPEVLTAGFSETMQEFAHAVRAAPRVWPAHAAEIAAAAQSSMAEYARRHAIESLCCLTRLASFTDSCACPPN